MLDDITDFESQYRYPSPNGLKQGGPTLWICILFVVLFGISTGMYSFRHACPSSCPTLTSLPFNSRPRWPRFTVEEMVHLPNSLHVWYWRAYWLGCEMVEFPERLQ